MTKKYSFDIGHSDLDITWPCTNGETHAPPATFQTRPHID